MITFFVGDTGIYLKDYVQQYDDDATLVTVNNFNNLKTGTYYISLGDLPAKIFIDCLTMADKIIYCPPEKWSDFKNGTSSMKKFTEFCCLYFSDKKQVENISNLIPSADLAEMLDLADYRKTDNKQIWIAGCSVSNGCAIPINLRYGQLIANKLEMPVSFLTHNGSSIEWSADQIIRSDIKEDDIIVWGLTSFSRVPFFKDNKINHITVKYYRENSNFKNDLPIHLLTDENSVYKNVSAIHRVISHCEKIKTTLIIAGILVDHHSMPYVANLPNFIQLHGLHSISNLDNYADFGTDNQHPGIKTHQWYAEEIIKKIDKCHNENYSTRIHTVQ